MEESKSMQDTLRDMNRSALAMAIVSTIQREADPKHAMRLICITAVGGLMSRGHSDVADLVMEFMSTKLTADAG